MSKAIKLGATLEGAPLELDIPRLIDSRMLIQGNSGGGKSWLLRLLCERAAAHVPIIVLDPEGEFASLREKLDLVLVGNDGEIATDLHSAGLLARKLIELEVSAVIDLYELKAHERREYVKLFLNALVELPRSLWHPTLICLDEAHKFAPEKGTGEAVSTQAVIDLMSLGRKRGFAGVLATQRFSKLHNDAIAETNNVFIGRTWLDADQKRAGEYLGMAAADRRQLRELGKGEFYAFGPALSIGGVNLFKSDMVATTHPQPGERHKLKAPLASDAIKHIVGQLEGLPEQAEAEVKDLTAAKKKIAELERELKSKPQAAPVQAKVKTIEVPVIASAELTRIERAIVNMGKLQLGFDHIKEDVGKFIEKIENAHIHLEAESKQLMQSLARATAAPKVEVPRPATHATPNARPVESLQRPARPAQSAGEVHIKAGARRMLEVVAAHHQLKVTRAQLATLARMKVTGGTFGTYFSTLKNNGLIVEQNGEIQITADGMDCLGISAPPMPQTTQELLAQWKGALKRGAAEMLDRLVDAHPDSVTREQLANSLGMAVTGGTFGTYLSTLRRNGLIEVDGDAVRASDTLFIGGR